MTQDGDSWTLTVARSDLSQTQLIRTPVPDLAPGEALLRRTSSPVVEEWVDVVVQHGHDALERVWRDVQSGQADPRTGNVLTL